MNAKRMTVISMLAAMRAVVYGDLLMRFSIAADVDLVRVLKAIKKYPECLRMQGGNPPTLVYFKANASAEELMRGAVDVMQRAVQDYLAAAESED